MTDLRSNTQLVPHKATALALAFTLISHTTMIFSRALTLVALPLLAVATAIQGRGGEPSSGASCCSTVDKVRSFIFSCALSMTDCPYFHRPATPELPPS